MSDQQFHLDFSGKMPISAQVGMAQADANAKTEWKRWVDGSIQDVARRMKEFTVDDVIEALQNLPNPPSTHNAAAIGPRMVEVSKTLKYMRATDRVQRSKRERSHGNLLRVWESLIWCK